MLECRFCNKLSGDTELMSYVIADGLRGVYYDTCATCMEKLNLNGDKPCKRNCECMLYIRGYLIINPRIQHVNDTNEDSECELNECTREAYINLHGPLVNESSPTRPSNQYAVFWDAVSGCYDINDTVYENGPYMLAKRLEAADKYNLEALKQIVRDCSGVDYASDDVTINGLSVLDWAATHNYANVIRALGEEKVQIFNDGTAFGIAVENNNTEIVYLLINYGYAHCSSDAYIDLKNPDRKVSAYEVGLSSTNPIMRSLMCYADMSPIMRRSLGINIDNVIEYNIIGSVEKVVE